MQNANPVYRSGVIKFSKRFAMTLGFIVVLLVTLGITGCGKDEAPVAVKTAADYFSINVGGQTVRMQLAVERPGNLRELNRGLMGRRDLEEDQGMIFVYQKIQQMSFYMRNTPTALDIGFFTTDGVLTEVRQMFPFDEGTVSSLRSDLQFALEMNQGWYQRHGVSAGAKLDMQALGEALKARGFRPEDYGIKKK